MISLIKNSTYPPGLTRDLMSLAGRYSCGSSPAPTGWKLSLDRRRQGCVPHGAPPTLLHRPISSISMNFSTFILPQTHMGADPITNSVKLRQGSRFSNHGGN